MAIEFIDSFNHYQTADLNKKWTYAAPTLSIVPGIGRRGDNAVHFPAFAFGPLIKSVGRSNAKKVAFAFKFDNFSYATQLLTFFDVGLENLKLVLTTNGTFVLTRYNLTVTTLAISTLNIEPESYYWLEAEAIIHSTAGAFKLKINGIPFINISGINTQGQSNNPFCNAFYLGPRDVSVVNSPFSVAEIFVANSFNLSYDGDKRVDVLTPIAAGNYNSFINSDNTSVDNYSYVDDLPQDEYSTYISGPIGTTDSYLFSSIEHNPATINAVQVTTMGKKEDAGLNKISALMRIDEIDYPLSSSPMMTSTFCSQHISEPNPSTGLSWTKFAVNNLEAGPMVV